MGLISSNICSYDKESDSEKPIMQKNISVLTSLNDNESIQSESTRKVKFSKTVGVRIYNNRSDDEENNLDVDNNDRKIINETKQNFFMNDDSVFSMNSNEKDCFLEEEEEKCQINYVQENRFVIEDSFYKFDYKLPKILFNFDKLFKDEDETSAESMDEEKKKSFKLKLEEVIDFLKNKNVKRIDGIIYKNNKLIILSENHIIDFNQLNDKFIINKSINFSAIDFITLASDYHSVIFHLVKKQKVYYNCYNNPIFDDLTNYETYDNYLLESRFNKDIISCISGSHLLKNTFEPRYLCVININRNFEVFNELMKIKEFGLFTFTLNNFLIQKLKKISIKINLDEFKYCGVKYNTWFDETKMNFKIADLIISLNYIYLLDYSKSKFQLIIQINLQDIKNIDINKNSYSFTINDRKKGSINIKTRSFAALTHFIKKIKNIHYNENIL